MLIFLYEVELVMMMTYLEEYELVRSALAEA